MLWRAWYADGSVYDSATAWQDLPAQGMVGVVVYREPPYRQIIDGGDWYWLEDGRIRRAMTHEEWGQYADPPGDVDPDLLKRSGVMEDGAWARVQAEMMEAREAPGV